MTIGLGDVDEGNESSLGVIGVELWYTPEPTFSNLPEHISDINILRLLLGG